MTMHPQSRLMEDTITLPLRRPSALVMESWGFSGSETEYQKGIRFCELYRAGRRTRLEEAELATLYKHAYRRAFDAVSYHAHKAGLSDPDTLADAAAALVDFCCKGYDAMSVGRDGQRKPYLAYMRSVAYSYLRKHQDFLGFTRKMTQTGPATGRDEDVLTAAWCGRATRDMAGDTEDVFEFLDQGIDPLFAQEWGAASPVEMVEMLEENERCDRDGLEAYPDCETASATLRDWVARTVETIRQSEMSPSTLADRAPAILERLREATGARVTDIAKRLMTQVSHGCAIARALLQALLGILQPQRHAQTIALIEAALVVSEQAAAAEPAEPEPVVVSEPVVTSTACASEQDDESDIGLIIDPADLFRGMVPPAKPRYVVVDTVPEEVPGAPPLDDDPGGSPGPTGPPESSKRAVHRDGEPPEASAFLSVLRDLPGWMPTTAQLQHPPPVDSCAEYRL